MKCIKIFLLLIILSSFLQAAFKDEFYLGITIREFNISKKNRIKRVVKDLEKKVNKEYEIKIHMVFYDDIDLLLKDYTSFKNINGVIIWSRDYLEFSKKLKDISLSPFLFKNSDYEYAQYYLVANNKSKIKNIEDIKNKTLVSYLSKDSTRLWLDKLSLETFNQGINNIIGRESIAKKRSSLILDVYFGKADFCVVRRKDYNDMIQMNPSIEKKIRIIKKSPEAFFYGLGLMNKKVSPKVTDVIFNELKNKKFYDKYKAVLELVSINSIVLTDFDYLIKINNFYEEYKKLKK